MNIAQAHITLVRISPQKARLVADLVRGKDVAEAIAILNNTNKKASPIFTKLINSAIANAVNNHGMSADKLYIQTLYVNEGPTMKRYQPKSKGRADRIFKRTSKMTVKVAER